MTQPPLKFYSHNIHGFNSPAKRSKVFHHLKSSCVDVVCLQETRFSSSSAPKYVSSHFPTFFQASAPEKQRGVLIAFRRNLLFSCSKEIADPTGRYLLLQGTLNGQNVTLVGYYAPNRFQHKFFSHLLKVVSQHSSGTLILMGDTNVALDSSVDRKYSSGSSPSHDSVVEEQMRSLLQSHGLVDAWRELHPRDRDFTYYSSPHDSFCRIDHVFVPLRHISNIHKITIPPSVWSDHDPIVFSFTFSGLTRPTFQWRLNDSLLTTQDALLEIQTRLQTFFKENVGSVSSPISLWEAHKATMRGHCIQLASIRKRHKEKRTRELTVLLASADAEWKSHPSLANRKARDTLAAELDLLASDQAEKALRWTKHKFYSCANKPGAMLAKKLNATSRSHKPIRLRAANGDLTSDPSKVTAALADFLASLYSKPSPFPLNLADDFFRDLHLPPLSSTACATLNADITELEVAQAIKGIRVSKAPGPDGFTGLYYRKLSPLLLPHLTAYFNSMKQGALPSSDSLRAHISMIPKTTEEAHEPQAFRPISLLNEDVKLLGKILCFRINKYLRSLVHRDQVGFVPGRQAGDNVRKVVHLITLLQQRKIPGFLLSLDIYKAFDTLSWDYLRYVLQRWGFGDSILSWLSALYSTPSASVRYAGCLSPSFPISRGTRQGCPLSPVLFVLALEPLAIALRADPNITGIPYAGDNYKLNMFADDALLTLTNPITTLPNLQALLTRFSTISGLRINPHKTTALNVTLPDPLILHLQSSFPYRWASSSLDYLGVKLTPSYASLFSANYYPLLRTTTTLMSSWQFPSLSWIGRIHAVKMTILPKILYFFRTLPVQVPAFYLRLLQNRLLAFIWAHKRPRVSRSTLYAHRLQGGLGVPNVAKYYQAAQISQLSMLHATSDIPLWVLLEVPNCAPVPISALLWLPPKMRPPSASPLMIHSLKLWDSIRYSGKLMSPFLPLLPLLNNPMFPPGLEQPHIFSWWPTHGFSLVRHFLHTRTFPTWSSFRETHEAPPAELYPTTTLDNLPSTPGLLSIPNDCL